MQQFDDLQNTDTVIGDGTVTGTESSSENHSRFPLWLTGENILTQIAKRGRRGFVLPVEILIFFAVFIIAQILPSMFIGVFATLILFASGSVPDVEALEQMTSTGPVSILISLAVCVVAILFCLVYCLAIEHRPIQSMGFRGKDFLLQYLKGLFFGLLLFSAVVAIGTILGGFRFVGFANEAPAMLIYYLIFFLIQGMQEEVLCRGYFMVSITRRSSVIAAVIANSLVFAALHLLNPGIGVMPIVNLILFGIFASLYMLRSGNIWGVGAIHSIWNFAQGNLFGLPVSGLFTDGDTLMKFEQTGSDLISGGSFGPEGGLPVTIVYVLAIIIVIKYNHSLERKSFK